jgi:signal transduction histidine kinase
MDRLTNRLWFRLTLVVLVIHAVLMPLLFSGLLFIVERSHADIFVDQVRSYGHLLADELELGDALETPARTRALLDSIILSGRGVYAEVIHDGSTLQSSLQSPAHDRFVGDDFEFGDHKDRTYFISIPVNRSDGRWVLRLGFDETQTWEHIGRTRRQIFIALALFTVVSVVLAIWLATRIAQPMIHLQNAARRIATGNFDAHLSTQSSIHEVQDLARHLESMRSELVGINARLSREVIERAAAEAQRRSLEERLRHSERVATVGTLAGGIAHEFNNIMTPILLYAQTARDEVPEGSPAAADLTRVIAAAHRARSLVNRILTFSSDFGTGTNTLVRISPVVAEALELLRAIVPSNVEITVNTAHELPAIIGDTGLIHQLVMNLCTNACQAMRVAGGVLSVRVTRERQMDESRITPGAYVVLEVSDTGHGMDADTRKRIFEPFFTTREVGEGTGLGLSVAHGIAASMRATILVDSEPGRGACFRVYFPVANAAQAMTAGSDECEAATRA